MYTRERIEEVVNYVLKFYSFEKLEDNTKENFLESIMIELDNYKPNENEEGEEWE